MKIRYFQDTNTIYLEFNQNPIEETKDVNENMLVDLDRGGKVYAITIEYTQTPSNLYQIEKRQR
ncbi:DUF2283 domain-containing protein [[Limnothrix rosea] IAM M-220]|uniref:DUF2283 domain-containing protein n=1 Tax=[Limnothrix rosea] IAM M-220 TaxID=454133 RepID=UPI0009699366|nr:DUF2283 domain-containing protein [[Limnothrix rosea] IAM M-220]OKH15247.1 hypothetical protein NIES208_12860 [[Limnothrix rosea] IAM M-220]